MINPEFLIYYRWQLHHRGRSGGGPPASVPCLSRVRDRRSWPSQALWDACGGLSSRPEGGSTPPQRAVATPAVRNCPDAAIRIRGRFPDFWKFCPLDVDFTHLPQSGFCPQWPDWVHIAALHITGRANRIGRMILEAAW